jgi:hypothetical protein
MKLQSDADKSHTTTVARIRGNSPSAKFQTGASLRYGEKPKRENTYPFRENPSID